MASKMSADDLLDILQPIFNKLGIRNEELEKPEVEETNEEDNEEEDNIAKDPNLDINPQSELADEDKLVKNDKFNPDEPVLRNIMRFEDGRVKAYAFKKDFKGYFFRRKYVFKMVVPEEKKEKKKSNKKEEDRQMIEYTAYDQTEKKANWEEVGKSFFFEDEAELVDHIVMNFPKFVMHRSLNGIEDSEIPTFPASDPSVRIHLLVRGDIYNDKEKVYFKNAGCQVVENLTTVN